MLGLTMELEHTTQHVPWALQISLPLQPCSNDPWQHPDEGVDGGALLPNNRNKIVATATANTARIAKKSPILPNPQQILAAFDFSVLLVLAVLDMTLSNSAALAALT